jgi:phage terminase small subunit
MIQNKTKRVSGKQYRWLQWYIKTGNATLAAQKAYRVSYKTGNVIGNENLAKLDYPQYLEAIGVTDRRLANKLSDGLDANKTVGAMGKDATASTSDFIDVPDWNARHKYLTTALTLKKRLEQQTTTVNIDKMMVLDATDGTTAPNDTTVIDGTTVDSKPIT